MTGSPETLNVTARAPFQLHYEGPAQVVSAVNKVGQFDILPGHADFFSMLKAGEVIIETETSDKPITFTISNGIVTVRDNEVMIFVDM